jgi:CubicO group peptidase (beta-lactamase class C family)
MPKGLPPFLLVLVLTLPGAPARADEEAALRALVDGVVAAQLETYRIPGATVAVVKDGRSVHVQGYGYADSGRRTPVVAETTVFRVASVGKLLVWTAVMQLVEQGQLDLDADIQTYLAGEQLPTPWPQPITLAHLMAHASGFEVPGRLWRDERPPARVRPPGALSAYSDHGTSLAQHIVEQVSGVPFEEYLRRHVFEPLDMKRSFFRRPVPPVPPEELARGHEVRGDTWRVQPPERVKVAPGGSMSATATDMARFMLAHLGGGRSGDGRILQEETVRRMHRQHFTHDPRVSGWAHGFMEFHVNGQRLIGHEGDAYLFTSLLVLLPEQGLGLFVAYNSPGAQHGAQRARRELLQALLDRYHPAPARPVRSPAPDFRQRATRFEGGYQTTWRAYLTPEASVGWRQEVRVSAGPEGTLRLQGPGVSVRDWVEVEPRVFQPQDGSPGQAVFREDTQGHITHLFFENRPGAAYVKAPWYETAAFTYGLLGVCAGAFVLALAAAPFMRGPVAWLLAALGLLELATLGGVAILLRPASALGFGARRTALLLSATQGGALLGVLLLLGAGGWTVHAWWRRSGSLPSRLLLTGVTLATLLFAAWLEHWHWV